MFNILYRESMAGGGGGWSLREGGRGVRRERLEGGRGLKEGEA